MPLLLALAAFAASPPSVDDPLATKQKAKKDVALVIGVEDYAELPDAPGARLDAKAAEAFFRTTRGVKDVRRVDDPKGDDLAAAVGDAAKAVKGGGTLWVWFSGQGGLDEKSKRVLLGADGEGVPLDDIVATAGKSKAKQALVIVDAGFGGIGRTGDAIGAKKNPPAMAAPSVEKVTVWTASAGGDAATYYPAAAHGLFSWLVLGGLRGWADGSTGGARNGDVSFEEAQAFVDKQLRAMAGKGVSPYKDPRADWASFSMIKTATEEGPDKDTWADLAAAEKTRRVTEAQKKVLTEATARWKEIDAATAVAGPTADASLRGYVEAYDMATIQVDGVSVAVVVPEVAEARKRLDDFARAAAKAAGKKRGKRGKKPKVEVPPPPPSETAACLDLVKLEPAAMTGALTADQKECLEKRVLLEPKQTTRDKVSRVLLANAEGLGDQTEWMRLAGRHLEDIDRSDPDLCFKYALLLSRTDDVQEFDDVITWVDYALENKARWEGPLYMSRVYNLYRLRAETATRMWLDAEDAYISDRTEENGAETDRLRGIAKYSAKEWLDYGRTSNQPTDRAFVLCESSSGSRDYCQAPPEDPPK